ncbi:MAG: DHA2 family efflux MFS transporter permease subunit [Desulfobacterota bacterium]|nr:DHA2 family efflux MFS transporter permease subunit [Thermodesulfobacteriota bacterium]MDW8002448.1 DHA2 family efflux MFS transporter permease subunit [Deltaproteobacteria bacterium]
MNKWIVTFTVMLPTLVEVIDMTIVNVALGHIRGSLGGAFEESTWILTMYMVSNAVIVTITGWLSRIFGRKNYLIISLSLFTLSSFLCGIAWSIPSIVLFRILQGIGGGGLQPISQAILLETFPKKEQGTAMAVFGTGVILGPIIGPILGGYITDNWSWHWIFFINIPIGLLSILMTILFIKDPPWAKKTPVKIDYIGLALVSCGVGALQIVLDQGQLKDWFSSRLIQVLTIVATICLSSFIVWELKSKSPVIDLRLFTYRSFSLGNGALFFTFFCLFGTIILLPLYLQELLGYTAYLTGLVLGPGGVMSIVALWVAGKAVNRVNPLLIAIAGLLTNAFACYQMSKFNLYTDFVTLVIPRVVLGFGMGLVFIPLTIASISDVKKEEMGMATSVISFIRNIGGSFGTAFVSTFLSRKAQTYQTYLVENLTPYEVSYQLAFEKLKYLLSLKGFSDPLLTDISMAFIYRELVRQSMMLSINTVFLTLGSFFIIGVALIVIMGKTGQPKDSHLI